MSPRFSYRNGYICASDFPSKPTDFLKHREQLASLRTIFLLAKQLSLQSERADLNTELCKSLGPRLSGTYNWCFPWPFHLHQPEGHSLASRPAPRWSLLWSKTPAAYKNHSQGILALCMWGGAGGRYFLGPVVVRTCVANCPLSGSQMKDKWWGGTETPAVITM